jgi:NAD(P)-dependent dehydrogenase (short-subunit alcohol dehydrogenase family)
MSVENPKTVIVTGAASGIGFACVQGLLAAGHRVCGADLQLIPTERLSTDPTRFLQVRANVAEVRTAERLWRVRWNPSASRTA